MADPPHGLRELAPGIELVLDLPSRLADDLASGKLDVALIPSVEYFQSPDYAIVSRDSRERREIDEAIECIGCGMCVSACTMVAHVEGSNKPTLNGTAIGPEPVTLKNGDMLELAGTQMQFLQAG